MLSGVVSPWQQIPESEVSRSMQDFLVLENVSSATEDFLPAEEPQATFSSYSLSSRVKELSHSFLGN